MSSVLHTIFHHGIYPFEEIVPKCPEYRAVNRKASDEIEYFTGKMSPEDIKRFEDFLDLDAETNTAYGCECFSYGFRLGAALMGEAFSGAK